MAPMASSSEQNADKDLPLELIVFSCGVCQATVVEVYATKDSNHGFHSGSSDDEGIVTKLWIGECSHILCSKHLPGGAVPFHPKGEQPRAPCPQCQERGDYTPKDLYGIRGLGETEMDTVIPPEWMMCPAIKLDGTVPGMEAVRFQYMNLARYAQCVTKKWKLAERESHAMESAYSKERKKRRQIYQEVVELKARIEALEEAEVKLQKWEARKPAINECLRAVHEMSSDIESMRAQLSQLGFDVPRRSHAFEPDNAAQHPDAATNVQPLRQQHNGKSFSSSSTAVAAEHDASSASRKRKLEECAPEPAEHIVTQKPRTRGSSRGIMPPPLPRLNPQQHALPPASAQSTGWAPRHPLSSRRPVQVREDNAWQPASTQQREEVLSRPRLNAQALPFRPSPSNSVRTDDHRQRQASFLHDSVHHQSQPYNTDAGRDASMSSWNKTARGGPLHRPDHRVYISPPLAHFSNHPLEARSTHYDAGYSQDSQQRHEQVRGPLQLFSASQLTGRLPSSAREVYQHDSPPPQGRFQRPTASVISPFFKRGAASRPGTQRPPTRGDYVQPRHGAHAGNDGTVYRMASSHTSASQGYARRPSPNGLSFMDKLHRQTDRQASYARQTHEAAGDDGYSRNHAMPQTPRNSQGLFQRPDGLPYSASYAHSRPQSNAYRARVTLPPSQHGTMTFAGSQEKALSQIRGVRGVSSQGIRPGQYKNGPLYDAPRTLFSSAGGKRSVRR